MSLRYLLLDGGWAITVDVHRSATGDTPIMLGVHRWILVFIPELFGERKLCKRWGGTWTRVERRRTSAQRSWNPHSHCLIWLYIYIYIYTCKGIYESVQQSFHHALSPSCHPGSTHAHLQNKYDASSPRGARMEKARLGLSRLMGPWRSVDTLGVIGQKPISWKEWFTCGVLAASTHQRGGRMCSHEALKFYKQPGWTLNPKTASSTCGSFPSWEQSAWA